MATGRVFKYSKFKFVPKLVWVDKSRTRKEEEEEEEEELYLK